MGAKARERTNGAQTVIPAKMRLQSIQVVTRSAWRSTGRISNNSLDLDMAGGCGVYLPWLGSRK